MMKLLKTPFRQSISKSLDDLIAEAKKDDGGHYDQQAKDIILITRNREGDYKIAWDAECSSDLFGLVAFINREINLYLDEAQE